MDQAGTYRALYHWEAIDVLWIEFVLILIATICWFAFRPWRKQKRKHIIKIQIASTFIIFAIWYFYPSIAYRGTYTQTTIARMREDAFSDIHITTDAFCVYKSKFTKYQINPIERVLWIDQFSNEWKEFPVDHAYRFFPVKLRWNKIIIEAPFSGRTIRFKKTKANQQIEPIATTPVDSVNTNSAQAHP